MTETLNRHSCVPTRPMASRRNPPASAVSTLRTSVARKDDHRYCAARSSFNRLVLYPVPADSRKYSTGSRVTGSIPPCGSHAKPRRSGTTKRSRGNRCSAPRLRDRVSRAEGQLGRELVEEVEGRGVVAQAVHHEVGPLVVVHVDGQGPEHRGPPGHARGQVAREAEPARTRRPPPSRAEPRSTPPAAPVVLGPEGRVVHEARVPRGKGEEQAAGEVVAPDLVARGRGHEVAVAPPRSSRGRSTCRATCSGCRPATPGS